MASSSQTPSRPSACERCRRRKTRCDGNRPKCGACTKANADCIEHDTSAGRRVDRSYLSYLEQRVAELEAQGGADTPLRRPSQAGVADTPSRNGSFPKGETRAAAKHVRLSVDGTVEREEYLSRPLPPPPPAPIPAQWQQAQPEQFPEYSVSDPFAAIFEEVTSPSARRSQPPYAISAASVPATAPQPALGSASLNSKSQGRDFLYAGKNADAALKNQRVEDSASRRKDSTEDSFPPFKRRRRGSSLSSTPPTISTSDRERDQREPLRNDALSCLVSVALEGKQEEPGLPFSYLLPSYASDDAERRFTAQELQALHTLRSQVRQYLRVPSIANDPAKITLYDRWIIDRLIKRFITYLGCALPVVHEVVAILQVRKVFAGTASLCDHFQVTMMIAIGLASITRSHRHTSDVARLGQDFYKAALRLLAKGVLTAPGVERIQCVLLMLLYSLLVPRSSNVAYLSSIAMQFALELNLHSDQAIQRNCGSDALMADIQRRLFWTCYSIDRSLSIIIGRPTTLADEWITTQLPSLHEDAAITTCGLLDSVPSSPSDILPVCQIKAGARHQTKLRQLQSKILAMLYVPVREDELERQHNDISLAEWSWSMYKRLREWRDKMQYSCTFVTREWVKLQFHLTTTLLFRPSPRRPAPDTDCLHVTLHSSVEALKLYKTMHRNAAINFTWMATHNLFMCGLSFLHSLRELQKQRVTCPSMSFVECVLQVQACASVLEALSLSEGHSGCKARDAFEQVSTLIVRQLETVAFRNGDPGGLGDDHRAAPSAHVPALTGSTIDSSSDETVCRFAALTSEKTHDGDLLAGDRQQRTPGWSCGDADIDNRHFYAHDTDAAAFERDRFASVQPHLYTMTSRIGPSLTMSQANGGRQYWSALSPRASSRALSPIPVTAHSTGRAAGIAESALVTTDAATGSKSPRQASFAEGSTSILPPSMTADALQMPFFAPDIQSWFAQPMVTQSPSGGFESEMAYENALLQALGFSMSVENPSPFNPVLSQSKPTGSSGPDLNNDSYSEGRDTTPAGLARDGQSNAAP